jgi:hypothetical protein
MSSKIQASEVVRAGGRCWRKHPEVVASNQTRLDFLACSARDSALRLYLAALSTSLPPEMSKVPYSLNNRLISLIVRLSIFCSLKKVIHNHLMPLPGKSVNVE